jgi:hypothetical protein
VQDVSDDFQIKKGWKGKRQVNYTNNEDESWMKAWENRTLDVVTGNYQTIYYYWQRIVPSIYARIIISFSEISTMRIEDDQSFVGGELVVWSKYSVLF